MLVNQAGETVASVGWDAFGGDVALFGGFVSAIQMFIERIADGTKLDELRFGNMKLLISSLDDYHVVTLHGIDESKAESENQEVVKLLKGNSSNINDGLLALMCELVSKDRPASAEVNESVKKWTQSQVDRAKKSASDWGKTVF
jgi:hypothetical protein